MDIIRKSRERKRILEACDQILQIIRPGDVVNQFGDFKRYKIWIVSGARVGQENQKHLFGKDSFWYDNHSMMFLMKRILYHMKFPIPNTSTLKIAG